MSAEDIEGMIRPGLWLLAEWSLRWGVILGVLATWFALRPPRRAVTRHALCASALVAGILLPFVPRWGVARLPWPSTTPATLAPSTPSSIDLPPTSLVIPDAGPGPVRRIEADVPADPPAAARAPGPWSFATWGLLRSIVAIAWGSAVLIILARWVIGQLVLVGLRRRASGVEEGDRAVLEECRRTIRLSRPVTLARHPSVASPAVLGGRRPLVLVPLDWDGWPESDRRACLLHELSHLARRDDWVKLAQEVIRIPFFFHPLVSWLLDRLDRERELLCDEAVVALGSDPAAYARLLLDLARRPGRIRPGTGSMGLGWLPFLDRGTVAARIEHLLEDDMSRNLKPLSSPRRLALVGTAFAATLIVGGLRIRTVEARPASEFQAPSAKAEPAARPTCILRGTILGPDDKPVADAIVVAGSINKESVDRRVFRSDLEGRFTWPMPDGEVFPELVVHKDGLATAIKTHRMKPGALEDQITIHLTRPEPFVAVLVDEAGRPVAGARVRIEIIASTSTQGNVTSTGFWHVRPEILEESPLERLFDAITEDRGVFALGNLPPGSWLRLGVISADGRILRVKPRVPSAESMMDQQGFVDALPGGSTRLVASPAARVTGRVTTALPGVEVAGLKVVFQGSQPRQDGPRQATNFGQTTTTDAAGRFVFEGLNDGTINVSIGSRGPDDPWAYRAARDVVVRSGQTAEVAIELIRGVEVEGKVVDRKSGRAIPGVMIGVYGPTHPRSGAMTRSSTTDAEGRYRYRLPAGETHLYVMGPPAGFKATEGQSGRTVTIPDGSTRFEPPALELDTAVAVRGKVVDSAGGPVVGAVVVGICEGGRCIPFGGTETITDARGEFRLPLGRDNLVADGQAARLLIRLGDKTEHEATALPGADGAVTVRLAVLNKPAPRVEEPRQVAADELTGVVVDRAGKPIEGVEADAWFWAPGHVAFTGKDGRFRIGGLPDLVGITVRFRKEGFETQFHLDRDAGKPGWVVVLGNTSYLEGRVLAPDGSPAPRASIRANSGPRQGARMRIADCYTETTSDAEGRYRLYAEPGVYDIEVRVAGVGVARLKEALDPDQAKTSDIRLSPGVAFVARTVDRQTGLPVAGVRLWHWQRPGIEARSDAEGWIRIADVPPGKYPRFQVEAKGYSRWWSEAALSEWTRYQKTARFGFQRNFDGLDFELTPGMAPVTIRMERGVTIKGRVLDPTGQPVAGATVAPALSGSGNSLTGDTRFSAETDAEGRFEALLPASGEITYNLVAHDGKFREWRTWANGVSQPMKTTPGEVIEAVELALNPSCTVTGRVVDLDGRPIAGREVRAQPTSKDENRYFDPTTRTGADGTFTLRCIRPGEHFVQAAPFYLEAASAPAGSSRIVMLEVGPAKQGIELTAGPDR